MAISQFSLRARALTDAPRGGVNRALDGARNLAAGAQLARHAPRTIRSAWRLGKRIGWAQGAAAVAPLAARGWWSGLTGRMEARVTRLQVRSLARWAPLSLAGIRLGSRGWSLLRRPAPTPTRLRAATLANPLRLSTFRLGAVRVGMGQSRALRGQAVALASKSTAQAASAAKASSAAKSAIQTNVAQRARTVTRAQRPARSVARLNLIQTTGKQLRAGSRFTRLFIMGFAVGMFWAYLFAPRPGLGFQAVRESSQRARSA